MPAAPVCTNAPLNIGHVRTLVSMLVPIPLAIVFSTVLLVLVRARFGSLKEQTNGGLGTSVNRLVTRVTSATTLTTAGGTAAAAGSTNPATRGGGGVSSSVVTIADDGGGGSMSSLELLEDANSPAPADEETLPRRERLGMLATAARSGRGGEGAPPS